MPSPLPLEHREHPARDQEAAEDVHRGQRHGQEAEDLGVERCLNGFFIEFLYEPASSA